MKERPPTHRLYCCLAAAALCCVLVPLASAGEVRFAQLGGGAGAPGGNLPSNLGRPFTPPQFDASEFAKRNSNVPGIVDPNRHCGAQMVCPGDPSQPIRPPGGIVP